MTQTRRTFLKTTGLGAVGATALGTQKRLVRAANANERVTVGVIGCSRGAGDGESLAKHGARIAYTCDPDEKRANAARGRLKAKHAVTDLRRVLDDKSVDAVVVATPDHWHGPAAILACEAGKHVYVEKPCSHNIREGRLMIEAARRHKRVMQVGSQSRSTPVLQHGVQLLREGAIGDVLIAKAWNSQRRTNIGKCKPSKPPAGFDYDLWVGPAPMRPFRKNCHHYTWHWWYDFGTGDAGNDGVHEMDIAVWGLGVDTYPSMMSGHGSKMFFDDDQEFPDTQYAVFEYPTVENPPGKKLLIYEHRIWTPYVQEGYENGNAFYGTKGYMILGKKGGFRLFGEGNKLIKEGRGSFSLDEHTADFLNAIRTGKRPNADIEIGHLSASLAHLANLLARTQRERLAFDPKTEQILGDPHANAFVKRTYRKGHWAIPKGV